MSNAMRFGKRSLAGVAAGALALGALTIASAPAASAGKTIKPKVSAVGVAGPVRAGTVGTIPYGQLVINNTLGRPTTLVMVTSPAGGVMWIDDTVGETPASTDDSAALLRNDNTLNLRGIFDATLDDSTYGIAVSVAGTYTAQLGNGTDTSTFTFTSSGAPASVTVTPATQTVLVGATAELELSLKDAAGNLTQPLIADTVALSDNTDDTIVATEAGTARYSTVTESQLATGVAYFYLRTFGNAAGTTTVTATPQGTLPSTGVAAATAQVTKSGTVATNSIRAISVTAPANAINAGTQPGSRTAQVPSPTTSVTVTIDDTTVAAAGNSIRLAATTGAGGFVNATAVADQPAYVTVTTDANKKATATFTLGGTAAIAGGQLTIQQVDVLGNQTSIGGTVQEVVSVVTPAVQGTSIVPSPAGTVTAKVGTQVPVSVQVDDSFGTPAAGWVVNAVRNPTGSTTCSNGTSIAGTGVTSAAGTASLNVTNLSTTLAGQSETYIICAVNPLTAVPVQSSLGLIVNYAATADVSSLLVSPTGNSAGSFSNTTTQTAFPALLVPGASNPLISTSNSVGVVSATTGLATTAPSSTLLAFTVQTNPVNTVTVTAPEGVKVSATAPNGTTTSFASGSQTATVTGNGTSTVYVWATKKGTHELTFSSTGMTVKGKIVVANKANDAYNIALTPATQTIRPGAIGTATLKVTDVFGNPVQTTLNDDSGAVTIEANGEILLAGYAASGTYATDVNGEARVTLIAGNAAGTGTLTARPTTGSTTPAWVASYTPPTGYPAPVRSAAATVVVSGSTPSDKSITITGSRTTVSGKPGIKIDGVVTGIDNGKTVIPYFRFPGETTFAEGTARPVISDGSFTWQRKTGKKFYAYVTSDDGVVKSNRVIIPAN